MHRIQWHRETRQGPRSTRSYSRERETHHVATGGSIRIEPLDPIHERAHEEEPTAVLALEVLWIGGVARLAIEIEPFALVLHVDDEALGVDFGTHANALLRILVVGTEDRVGD